MIKLIKSLFSEPKENAIAAAIEFKEVPATRWWK